MPIQPMPEFDCNEKNLTTTTRELGADHQERQPSSKRPHTRHRKPKG